MDLPHFIDQQIFDQSLVLVHDGGKRDAMVFLVETHAMVFQDARRDLMKIRRSWRLSRRARQQRRKKQRDNHGAPLSRIATGSMKRTRVPVVKESTSSVTVLGSCRLISTKPG